MTKRVMHPRAIDKAFAKAFNLIDKMGPRELRDKMKEMGYKSGTGLFQELMKSRGKSRFKDGGVVDSAVINMTKSRIINTETGE